MTKATTRWLVALGGLVLLWALVEWPRSYGDASGPRVTGVVIGPDGAPVAGATVAVASPAVTAPYGPGVPVTPGPVEATLATTGADGRFSVAAPPGVVTCAVAVETPAGAFYFVREVAAVARLTVRPVPGASLTGRVIDTVEKPVAGARVRARLVVAGYVVDRSTTTASDGTYRLNGWPTTLSGAERSDGRGELGAVDIDAPGYAPLVVEMGRAPVTGASKTLVLTRGGRLEVRVVQGESGAPAAGVKVLLWSAAIQRSGRFGETAGFPALRDDTLWSPRVLATATSGPDGLLRLDRVPCPSFHPVVPLERDFVDPALFLTAFYEGAASTTSAVVPDGEGVVASQTLRLWPDRAVYGRAVDDQGRPVVGALIEVQAASLVADDAVQAPDFSHALLDAYDLRPPNRVVTGADGRFRVGRIPARRGADRKLTVLASMLPTSEGASSTEGKRDVLVAANVEFDVGDLLLERQDEPCGRSKFRTRWPFRVMVTLPDGSPAVGARIVHARRTVRDRYADPAFREGPAELAVAGLGGLAVGCLAGSAPGPVRLLAVASGFVSDVFDARPDDDRDGEVTLSTSVVVLRPAVHRIVGHVRQASGGPAVGARVVAGWQVASAPSGSAGPNDGFVDTAWTSLTDPTGAFAIDGVPAGRWDLSARASPEVRGRVNDDVASGGVTVGAVTSDPVMLVLPDVPPLGRGGVSGTLLDPLTGRGALEARVTLWRQGRFLGGAASGYDGFDRPGRFLVEDLEAGLVEVLLWARGRVPRIASAVVVAGETTTLEPVVLSQGVTVRGRVRGAESFPLAALDARSIDLKFRAERYAIESDVRRVRVAADGSFDLSGFSPGTWYVAAEAVLDRSTSMGVPLALESGPALEIPRGVTDVAFEPVLVAGAFLGIFIGIGDDRFPSSRGAPIAISAEQQRAADEGTIEVLDRQGAVVLRHVGGLRRGSEPTRSLVLKPGRYTVRASLPGTSPHELGVEVSAGQKAFVVWTKRGLTQR